MNDAVDDLLALLDLEDRGQDRFRANSLDTAYSGRLFGGQLLAQCLAAACRTVDGRACHSLHAYFTNRGDPSAPITYEVERSHDGGAFTTRRVVGFQGGRQLLNIACSFHVEETGWNHQHDRPDVIAPEEAPCIDDLKAQIVDQVPEAHRTYFVRREGVEIREVEPVDLLDPQPVSDLYHVWIRIPRRLDVAPWVHQCLLAYASDMRLLGAANRRHGLSWLMPGHQIASLDHSMWFHTSCQFDDWLLYRMDSPYAGNGRSFNRGMMFTRSGELVASVAQEGLMRPVSED